MSYITGTIENFQTINSEKILFPIYQLKILQLTVMAWKVMACIKTLDELALQKKKYSGGNKMPFINKTIKRPL